MRAVFLDRDGVINELVLNPATGEYEPPHSPDDMTLFPWVINSLKVLRESGFELFMVSNQPDYAKGKVSLEAINAVHTKLDGILSLEGIQIREYYYCYHHPRGVVPGYSFECACRKPKPFFILNAAKKFGIDLSGSWMIGDRDTDIECGKQAGVSTILVEEKHSSDYRGSTNPDYYAANLKVASQIIFDRE